MDRFDYFKNSAHPMSGMEGNKIQERVAPDEYSPDYRLFHETQIDNEDIILEVSKGPTDCSIHQRYTCLADALRLLRNQMSERDALIFVGRFYYRLKLKDLEVIFRLDLSNISRIAQKAERKLGVLG